MILLIQPHFFPWDRNQIPPGLKMTIYYYGIKVHSRDGFDGSDRTKCSLIIHEFLKITEKLCV